MQGKIEAEARELELSVVIPAYRTGSFIDKSILLKNIILKKLGIRYEIIVVLDGPDSIAFKKIKKMNNPVIRIFELPRNFGKGYAVRYGFAKSNAKYVGYIDADNDINPKILESMYLLIKDGGSDAVIGSKLHPGSKIEYPVFRKIYSNFFNFIIKLLFNLRVSDTQTGAKMYTREAINLVLPECQINRFAFEIEMLSLVSQKGLRIKEAPVQVDYVGKSSIIFADGLQVMKDIIKLFFGKA